MITQIGIVITDDPRYFNANLVRHPFSRWGEQSVVTTKAIVRSGPVVLRWLVLPDGRWDAVAWEGGAWVDAPETTLGDFMTGVELLPDELAGLGIPETDWPSTDD